MRSAGSAPASFRAAAAALLVFALGLATGCDDRKAEIRPDRDTLYSLFERAADFATALDRLDIVCGSTGAGGRADWVREQGAAILDPDQQARLDAFIEDHKHAVFETYKKEYCGMAVAAERDNYVAAYKVHKERLEGAIDKTQG